MAADNFLMSFSLGSQNEICFVSALGNYCTKMLEDDQRKNLLNLILMPRFTPAFFSESIVASQREM